MSLDSTPSVLPTHASRSKRKHDSSGAEAEAEAAPALQTQAAAAMSLAHATRSHSDAAIAHAADAAAAAAAAPFPLASALSSSSFDCSALPHPTLRSLCAAIFRDAQIVHDQHAVDVSLSPPPARDGSEFRLSSASLSRLLRRVESLHHAHNTYHAFPHAVHVMFQLWRILRTRMLAHYSDLERLTILLAALCHDLAHCGQSNALCLSRGYMLNHDHAAKAYTHNILERNSVERATEMLQGKKVAVPTGAEHSSTGGGSSSAELDPTPINFLHEWGLSPAAQSTLLHDFSELILGTDIGDLERHLKIKAAFAAACGHTATDDTKQRGHHAQSRSNSHLAAASIDAPAQCSTPASDVALSSSTAVHPHASASPARSHSKSGASSVHQSAASATATAMDLCSTPSSDVPLSSSTSPHAAASAHAAPVAHKPAARSSSGHSPVAAAPVRVCSTPGSDVPLSSSMAVHPHAADGHALHAAAAAAVPVRSKSSSSAQHAHAEAQDLCSTPASDAPLTSSTAVHPVSHHGAAPALCSTPSSDVADSSSTAVHPHRSPSGLSSPPPAAAAAHRSPSRSPSRSASQHAHFSWSNAAHRRALSQLVLLVSDVGCVSELFPICLSWADRLFEENTLGQSYVRQTAAAASRRQRGAPCPHKGHHAKKARDDSTAAAREQEEKQREEAEEEAETAAAAAPFVSQYIRETADLPSAVPAAAASASSAASAAAVASASPSPPLRPDPLLSFYASQQGFLQGYALPLFALLHHSDLLPRPLSSQLLPQLQFNLRVLGITEVSKPPPSSKITLHVRRGQTIDEQARQDIERIKQEYRACAEFHRQLCTQQDDAAASASASPTHAAAAAVVAWPQRSAPVHSMQFVAD